MSAVLVRQCCGLLEGDAWLVRFYVDRGPSRARRHWNKDFDEIQSQDPVEVCSLSEMSNGAKLDIQNIGDTHTVTDKTARGQSEMILGM